MALAVALALGAAAPVTFAEAAPVRAPGAGDATVIAVLDSGMSPYHWDFLASKMPQHTNRDRSDDLPLTASPDKWLPGFPKPSAFKSYQPLKLSFDQKDDVASMKALHEQDKKQWSAYKPSGPDGVNYYWIPNTKVIGALSFEPEQPTGEAVATLGGAGVSDPVLGSVGPYIPFYGTGGGEHGMGSASVSTGNIYGTCPECLLVFIQFWDDASGNRAIDWALKQPWIDAITNSYGFHTAGTAVTRDNVYGGASTGLQKAASERGQTVFWSAGNGYENAFTTPNQTLMSAQKGPDWIVTVTGATPNGKSNYTGAGKPADLAGVGEAYPSSYGSTRVTGGQKFSGTSNATPTVAGTYGRALYLARRAMRGNSRLQSGGVIAKGAFTCGTKRRKCELGDGKLTAAELRTRLLHGALHRTDSHAPAGDAPQKFASDERYLVEGHGTYLARVAQDDAAWLKEFDQVRKPLFGLATPMSRPEDERDWFIVDSWCRQKIWGAWKGGYYVEGKTKMPADDSSRPTRTSYRGACTGMQRPPNVPPV
ncbi:MAG TPA: S8/S53 family peptidase [Frankiaceae bacterium]|nr:S8/S53 family peptidase [Frankiaceae bacterium]